MIPPVYQRIYCCRCKNSVGFTESIEPIDTAICYNCICDEFNVLYEFGVTNDNVFDRQHEYELNQKFAKRLELSRNVSLWTELRDQSKQVTTPPNFNEKFD